MRSRGMRIPVLAFRKSQQTACTWAEIRRLYEEPDDIHGTMPTAV